MDGTELTNTNVSRLTDRERELAILLEDALRALWREWVEAGSNAAKASFEAIQTKRGKLK